MRPRRRHDVSAFAGVPLFAGYDRRRLAPFAHHVDRLAVTPGATLARAGRRPHEVVVVLAGDVAVSRAGVETGRLGPGAVIGASEELSGTAHDATFVAAAGVDALVMSGRAFRCAVHSLPGLRERLGPEHLMPAGVGAAAVDAAAVEVTGVGATGVGATGVGAP